MLWYFRGWLYSAKHFSYSAYTLHVQYTYCVHAYVRVYWAWTECWIFTCNSNRWNYIMKEFYFFFRYFNIWNIETFALYFGRVRALIVVYVTHITPCAFLLLSRVRICSYVEGCQLSPHSLSSRKFNSLITYQWEMSARRWLVQGRVCLFRLIFEQLLMNFFSHFFMFWWISHLWCYFFFDELTSL